MQPMEQRPVTEVPEEGWKQVSAAAHGWYLLLEERSRGLWHLNGVHMVFESKMVNSKASFFVEPLQPLTSGLHGAGLSGEPVAGRANETVQVLRGARESRLNDKAAL